jgi:hypothetical protein
VPEQRVLRPVEEQAAGLSLAVALTPELTAYSS